MNFVNIMRKILLILICVMVFLFACDTKTDNNEISASTVEPDAEINNNAEPIYRKISAEEAREIMESTESFILLDVRTEQEFSEQRITGAILIPDFEIANRAASELPDRDALILIYCRSGRRSANAAHELVGMGYTNVYDFGGILDWDYDTVSENYK